MLGKLECTISSPSQQRAIPRFRKTIETTLQLLATALLFSPIPSLAEKPKQVAFGVAWRAIGAWHMEGQSSPISTGDAIVPGSLLQPADGSRDHSITVLLPDGQRVLYECFSEKDCERGFRVPSLYREPDPVAVDMLGRVNAVLLGKIGDARPVLPRTELPLPRDEVVAVLDDQNKVEILGLVAALSRGSYWYEVRPLSQGSQPQARRSFDKSSRSITLTLPSEGLFEVSITDQLNTPRIDLFIAAVHQPRAAGLLKSFHDVHALLMDWNEDYQGWPIHDFQRCYLRSVLVHIPPSAQWDHGSISIVKKDPVDVTAEPRFSPAPGAFHGDTQVVLQSETSGATIHYTVDGSQPFTASSVYHAPIMVKGTELTIKAFASAEGKKDSPVVTGIFRIGD
jgi:hypothetical protein